ncbi:THAP domain-containing protein 2-like [Photinus pyralis]|uniref:THAP domain-containing protein 2-like n=1 Tax=Photinus pyralis TaxID=7054 RepID=UPI0012671CBA|nr:THAP domain-containing protein 2-like [Photinus pyralis]
MGGCAAEGCSNSAKKGFLMKRFPRDPKRKQEWMEWIIKMKKGNWQPTDAMRLCEVHFGPEMWEKTRVDGKRVLKCNAVPTMFAFSKSTLTRKAPTPENTSVQELNQTTDYGISDPEPLTSAASSDILSVTLDENIRESSPSTLTASTSFIDVHKDCKSKFLRYEKMYIRERQKARRYKQMLCNIKKENKTLKDKASNIPDEYPILRNIFNEDQVEVLKKRKSNRSIVEVMAMRSC